MGTRTSSYAPILVNSIQFNTVALNNGETMEWTAFDSDGKIIEDANWTVVRYSSVTSSHEPTGSGDELTVSSANDVVSLDGEVYDGWSVNGAGNTGSNEDTYILSSDVAFSTIAIEAGTDTHFDVGYIDIAAVQGSFDVTTTFDVTVTDGDGDVDSETVTLTFSNDETLVGTTDADVILGSSGDDDITGGDGDDILIGGDGDDNITGGEGDDELYGGAGEDIITGGAGEDELFGGADADTYIANDGAADTIGGGATDDLSLSSLDAPTIDTLVPDTDDPV